MRGLPVEFFLHLFETFDIFRVPVAFRNLRIHCKISTKLKLNSLQNIDKIKLLPRTKCADRSGKCHWPELEESLARWVEENRNSGYVVTRTQIILEATRWANKNGVTDFSGHRSWCSRFMKRHNLVIRQQTKISQKLPTDLEEKITEFQRFIIKCRKQHDYSMASIANMDETPTWFDMPSSKTVNKAGEKTVYVRTSGHEKVRFTTVLACLADGTKLKPMVILSVKPCPKKYSLQELLSMFTQKDGWMRMAWRSGLKRCGVLDPVALWKPELFWFWIRLAGISLMW